MDKCVRCRDAVRKKHFKCKDCDAVYHFSCVRQYILYCHSSSCQSCQTPFPISLLNKIRISLYQTSCRSFYFLREFSFRDSIIQVFKYKRSQRYQVRGFRKKERGDIFFCDLTIYLSDSSTPTIIKRLQDLLILPS